MRRARLDLAVALLALLAGFLVLPAPTVARALLPPAVTPPSGTWERDFADPHVLRTPAGYYAYATNTGGRHLPVLHSTDLRSWAPAGSGDALPEPARWAAPREDRRTKETWAPAVVALGGRYVAYYAVRVAAAVDRFCLSVATADAPTGPFRDTTRAPLACDLDPNGSIDPFPYVEARTGTPYLLWKSEGLPGRAPKRLVVRQLRPDGLGFAPGTVARELLRPTLPWHGTVVENPAMVQHRGQLYLFYSANGWDSSSYAQGVARCASPLGPCAELSDAPLLAADGDRVGRAGGTPFVDARGRLRLAYHWWQAPRASYAAGGWRRLSLATLAVRGGQLVAVG